jgi:acetyl esterase/lipase
VDGRRDRRKTRGVVYADVGTHRLKLDVYEPVDPAPPGHVRPAIMQIHGGAWVVGSKDEQGVPLLNHLARNGWVGFNVEYRLSPSAKFPTHLQDCKRALAWIREHADDYGIDPGFVAVTGGSAGGHLCALMALTAGDPHFQPGFEATDTSVQAAVPFYGVYDLTDRDRDQIDRFVRFLEVVVMGSHPEQDPEGWAAYSPVDRVHPEAPPMMLLHGSNDVLVPVAGARRFAALLREVSRQPVVYAELTGAQHAFDIVPSIRTVHTVEYVERFLHHLWVDHQSASAGGDSEGRTSSGYPSRSGPQGED